MITNYINKNDFQKKIRAMRVKFHMEDNITLTWMLYVSVCILIFLLIVGAVTVFCTLLTLFIIGLPLAFIEGVVKGYRKNDEKISD